jgi:ATP-binding cassette subfamily F protein 3
MDADPSLVPAEARHLLARYLFTEEDVFKSVATLSGGQRSRLALARLSRQQANFLVLDEPTNHLDVESQEVLEDVLADFPGTVLLASHDRYLIDALATQVWAVNDRRLTAYEGNYTAYLAARQTETEAPASPDSTTDAKQHRERSREERRKRKEEEKRQSQADAVEQQIHALEHQLIDLSAALTVASRVQRLGEVQALGERYAQTEQELHRLIENWAVLAEAPV